MNIKPILKYYFLPLVFYFFAISLLSNIPVIQEAYYPFFEKISLLTLKKSQPSIYFKARQGTEEMPNSPAKLTILFNTKTYLQKLMNEAKRTGKQGKYNYVGFVVSIDETFIAPLVFFISLLLVTPGTISRKTGNLMLGGLLIIGFTCMTVYFKALYSVAESGIITINHPNELKLLKLLHYAFSSVTSVTVVILVWILLTLRKSNLSKLVFVKT